jgi:hypothetical protein
MNGVETVLWYMRSGFNVQQSKLRTNTWRGGGEERGGEKPNARYADAELDVLGLARYRRHAVVHVRREARESVQVCLVRRREGLQWGRQEPSV